MIIIKNHQLIPNSAKLICLLVLMLLTNCTTPPTRHERTPIPLLNVHFLNVGQGTAHLLELAGNHFLLDAGSGKSNVGDSLRTRGVDSLAWILLSHWHEDHVGGFFTISPEVGIGEILVSSDTGQKWLRDSLLQIANYRGIPVRIVERGDTLAGINPWRGRIVWPPAIPANQGNAASLVVHVRLGNQAMLFPGDIGMEQESALLLLEPTLRAQWIASPHHGSATSAGLSFIGSLGLEFAVLSSGLGNEYGHPRAEHLARLYWVLPDSAALWRTDLQGSLHARWKEGFGILRSSF